MAKALKLTYNDSLFNAGTYTIIHNGDEYNVEPVLFQKYSRKFSTLFNFNENHIEVNDGYDRDSFSLFVKACQCEPIEVNGLEAVNLLLLAEHWEATTLAAKIEQIIKNTIPPKDILEFYIKLAGTEFPIERLESIMIASLPKYIEEPLFPTLPYEVLDRIIHASRAKISAAQIVNLCYAVAQNHGMRAISVINHTSFDDLPSDELTQLSKLFRECPYDGLKQFFEAMGRLIYQVSANSEGSTQFEVAWRNGENRYWTDAYAFYEYIHKYQKERVRQEEGDEAAEAMQQSKTTIAFLKISADKGYLKAQYEYGVYLMQRALTHEDRVVATNYLVQAAAEGNADAVTALRNILPLNYVPTNMKQYAYAVLALQNLLLNINKRNVESTKSAIFALPFGTERDGIAVIVSNILRAVLIRQRSINLYASVVLFLMKTADENNNYGMLKATIFTKVMETLVTTDPHAKQFVLLRFLYTCNKFGIIQDDELAESLADFMRTQKHLVASAMLIFYYFAPLIEKTSKELYKQLYLMRFEGGLGTIDPMIKDFKDRFVDLRKDDWDLFKEVRLAPAFASKLGEAIADDNLGKFEALSKEPGFDINMRIPNDLVELDLPGTEELTLLQYACLQGAQVIFTHLLQRGAVPREVDDATILCAVAGQNEFVAGFITKKAADQGELFRVAAGNHNMAVIASLLVDGCPLADADENGRTAFHYAVNAGLPDMVKVIMNLDGMDLNAADEDGLTALHLAAQNDDIDLIRILSVSRGIVLDCRTNNNELPYDLAHAPDVKQILRKK